MATITARAKKKFAFNRVSPVSNIIINIICIILFLLCVLPIILMLMVSFTDEKTIMLHGYSFLPAKFSTYAYQYIVTSAKIILSAYGVTIFVSVIGTTLSLLVMSMYAYPLSRSNFTQKNFFSFFAFFTLIFGGGLVPWVMVYSQLFKIDFTIWILIIPYLMNAWWIIILRTFMKTSVPEAIIESARIDGASEFRTFFQMVLPLARRALPPLDYLHYFSTGTIIIFP